MKEVRRNCSTYLRLHVNIVHSNINMSTLFIAGTVLSHIIILAYIIF